MTSIDVLLDTGLAFADDHNLRHGLGWRYGLQDEFAKVNTGNLATARRGAVAPFVARRSLVVSGGVSPAVHSLSKAQASAQASGAAAAVAPVWPAVAGLYGPPYAYNALDLDLYFTSRVMAVLDAALFHYAAAAGLVEGGAGVQAERKQEAEEREELLAAPCGHIGRH